MRVYGDHPVRADPAESLAELLERLQALEEEPAGILRHGALVRAFVDASALVQGLIDAEFEARGCVDAPSPLHDAALSALTELARSVLASWDAGFSGDAPPLGPWRRLGEIALPNEVTLKRAEGYAFYALYPEAYAIAAREAELGPSTLVLGLRSIGTGLAAMAAAAIGASAPATVRPVGEPFARRLAMAAAGREALARAQGEVTIVDEGPGLSGSSFAAAIEAAQAAGVARERIVLLPSHAGDPGGQAGERVHRAWAGVRRACIPFDSFALSDDGRGLAAWVRDLTGEAKGPLADIGGGAWRSRLLPDDGGWPPADTFQERRKYRLGAEGGEFRLKFLGLDAEAQAKLARGGTLAEAGFSPPALGLRHGFLVEPWMGGWRPLTRGGAPPDLHARLADYLVFRAEQLAAPADRGADLAELAGMARVNAAEALGEASAVALLRRAELAERRPTPPRVWTDNRLNRHEWLRAPDGRLLKTDAVDHACGHDLVGAQESAWDLAGARFELGLRGPPLSKLAERLHVHPDRAAFFETAYLAFQLGASEAARAAHAHLPAEQARWWKERRRYERLLAEVLAT